jgi:mannose-6-phosphate isomerase-like protein (cupin superfamily)
MLPNRFPDAGEPPEYNTVDAALWFIEAARCYLDYTGDMDFVRGLYDRLLSIIDWHLNGYMVYASRREQPGVAEIHTKDADIIYVLEGSSTFVTGGTAVAPAVTAPDEIRGKKIEGGDTRQIAKGDVIIVPAGVPHWFKEVTNPFLYYVVKAR